MGLTNWNPPTSGKLEQAPRPPSVDCLLALPQYDRSKIEALCNVYYCIEPEITPDLAEGGRLRPFVHIWMGSQLRFWDKRLHLYGRGLAANDLLCRALVKVGLASSRPGSAEAWLQAACAIVCTDFAQANLKLTAGGSEGNSAVVLSIQAMHNSMTTQTAAFQSAVLQEVRSLRGEIGILREGLLSCQGQLADLLLRGER